MTKFPVNFYAGEDWNDADLIAQTYAVTIPRQGERVSLANTTGGPVNYPVTEVQHDFSDDDQTIKVLLHRAAPSVYEKRGVMMV